MNSRHRIQEVICPPMPGRVIEAGYHGPSPWSLPPEPAPHPARRGKGVP